MFVVFRVLDGLRKPGTLVNRKVKTVLVVFMIKRKSVLYLSVVRFSIIGTVRESKLGKESFDIIRHKIVAIYSFL